jgi:choline dehydrogenase
MNNFDIIIIGAGSAGSILASKLSENKKLKILILESGPKDYHPMIKIPLGYGMTFYNKEINWNFYSKAQKQLNDREIYMPRGKVLGGSGSINAMVYTRGLKTDFKDWANTNNTEWSIDNIEHSYNEIEKNIIINDKSSATNKITVNDVSEFHHDILKYYFRAAKELDLPFLKNLNKFNLEGVGNYNITTRNGYRWSAASGFLKPSLKRENICLITKANVTKLIIKGKKVLGVEYEHEGLLKKEMANIGVVMSSGAIKTPQILMLSGIGPGKILKKNGIQVLLNNESVGSNLQDHIGLDYLYKSSIPTLNQSLGKMSGRIKSMIQYLLFRSGPFSLSLNQGGGFIKWKNKEDHPNLQIYFNPLTYSVSHRNKRPLLKTDKFSGFIIGFNSCRPKSKGEISIKSNNIKDDPIIDPNYLSNDEDLYDLECAFDFVRNLSSTSSMKNIIKSPLKIDPMTSSNKELISHFKENASSVYHPCGTCRMGEVKESSVISHRLKVHDLENLWIVDASIFPNIPSGNINAPVMMSAFIGSQIILEDIKI